MYPLKFVPILKSLVWGGEKIAPFKHIETSQHNIGESWELSGVQGNESVVANGEYAGRTISELVAQFKDRLIGKRNYARTGNEFPLLIKFIDAKQDLSIQVHPNDELAARRHNGSKGKTDAGALAATSTSGPGVCLKSEAMNLAVITELPLVVVNVQRGGPSTGLPTKSEQTDLLQALFGRNGESPMPVIAAASPTHCFDAAYDACKIALEHMTPVVLLTDGFVANGSGAWKLPDLASYPAINPPYVTPEMKDNYTPYKRNPETGVRYWALPGQEGYMHILGGLEKDTNTGAISTDPENHNLMCHLRAEKVAKIPVPDVKVQGCADDADLLIVGFGGTYGHLYSAMEEMNQAGKKVALAHFVHLNPLPQNTAEVLKKYKKVVVAEQSLGQFAGYLRMKVDGFVPYQFNEVKGQPFVVSELVDAFNDILNK